MGVMSDLCIYELDDNVWDEFSESDDHIVPRPSDQYSNPYGSSKRPRHEVADCEFDDPGVKTERREDTGLCPPTTAMMLDKSSWSHPAADDLFRTPCDNSSGTQSIAPEQEQVVGKSESGNIHTTDTEFCGKDPVLAGNCAAVNNNEYDYPLNDASQAESDLTFFGNDQDNKGSSALLYYEWPDDIGNFEDVDRMFRSCDATFGLESLGDGDDMCWFPSSHPTEASEEAPKMGSKFLTSERSLDGPSQQPGASRPSNAVSSLSSSQNKSTLLDEKTSSGDSAAPHQSKHLNGSDTKSINSPEEHFRLRHQLEGRKKERAVEDGDYLHLNENSKPFVNSKHSCGKFSSHETQQNSGTDNDPQAHIQYMSMDYDHSPDHLGVGPFQSGIKYQENSYPTPSHKGPSYASNLAESLGKSNAASLETPPTAMDKKCEKQCNQESVGAQPAKILKCANIADTTFSTVVQKQVGKSEFEMGSCSEIDGVEEFVPVKLDSNAQESSGMSYVLDDISLEATSFRQLQQVTEQLDIRTKLCIRDSLYRLARSAVQRHNSMYSNGGKRDNRDADGATLAEGTNRAPAFMDIETDTNPIDRSIAHLLFHRPSDSSVLAPNDPQFISSNATTVQGSMNSSTMSTKGQVLEDAARDTRLLTSDNSKQ